MRYSCTIIGPSDKTKLWRFGKIKRNNYKRWQKSLVNILSQYFDELYFIPDRGVYVDFCQTFKNITGKKIIAFIPLPEEKIVQRAKKLADKIRQIPGGKGWSYLNTHVIGQSKFALCLGYSPGSILEICSIKYLNQYQRKNIILLIDERCISQKLPKELIDEINDVFYFSNTSQLKEILNGFFKKEKG
jgi:hypothetical protein